MQAIASKKVQENTIPKPYIRPIDLLFEERKSAASALAITSSFQQAALQGTAILPKE